MFWHCLEGWKIVNVVCDVTLGVCVLIYIPGGAYLDWSFLSTVSVVYRRTSKESCYLNCVLKYYGWLLDYLLINKLRTSLTILEHKYTHFLFWKNFYLRDKISFHLNIKGNLSYNILLEHKVSINHKGNF